MKKNQYEEPLVFQICALNECVLTTSAESPDLVEDSDVITW